MFAAFSRLPASIGRDVREAAGVLEELLAALHFTLEARVDPLHEVRIVTEVRDDARDVREIFERCEGRTTLVVDENHVDIGGGMPRDETEHEGSKKLRFTGTRRTDREAVRAHAVLRRFLEVEHDRRALIIVTDLDAKEARTGPRGPRLIKIDVGELPYAEKIRSTKRLLSLIVFERIRCETHARKVAREGPRLFVRELVELDREALGLLVARRVTLNDCFVGLHRRRADAERDVVRFVLAAREEVQHREANVRGTHLAVAKRNVERVFAVVVGDDPHAGHRARDVAAAKVTPKLRGRGESAMELGAEHLRELLLILGDTANRPVLSSARLIGHVRKPRHPRPEFAGLAFGVGQRHLDVFGRGKRCRMAREKHGDAAAERLIAHDAHVAHGVERDRYGRIGHRGKAFFNAVELARHEFVVEAHRVVFTHAFKFNGGCEAGSEAQAHEVLVITAALPQPRGRAREA